MGRVSNGSVSRVGIFSTAKPVKQAGLYLCGLLVGIVSTSTVEAQSAPLQATLGYHTGLADVPETDQRWQSWTLTLGKTLPVEAPLVRIRATLGVLQSDSASGLADTWVSMTRLGQRRHIQHWWDVRAKVKLPTADAAAGLGTGSVDEEIGLRALAQWGDWVPWYALGYRWRGASDYYDLQDGLTWGAGLGHAGWNLSYQGRTGSRRQDPSRHVMSVGHGMTLFGRRWSPYLSLNVGRTSRWGTGLSAVF